MATSTDPMAATPFDKTAFASLIQRAEAEASTQQAWLYLEAAHVVGQRHLASHLSTHAHMLRLAWNTHDWPELVGQILRLWLVPFGHLSGRLPLGNPGRATVSAFEPLPVRSELAELIARVRSQ